MNPAAHVGDALGIGLSSVTISYGSNPVLDIGALELAAGGYTLITGPTGCGKSSLALALVGVLEEMTGATLTGSITVDGQERLGEDPVNGELPVAAVWQRPDAQLFRRTILEEVRAGLDFRMTDAEAGTRRARAALRSVGLDHLDESRDPLTLSGGEQQRLALAAALVLDAPILVLDEAASQLDAAASARFSRIIAETRAERGLTVIAFDHRPDPHLATADRVIVLDRSGTVALDGGPAEVYGTNAHHCRDIGIRLPAAPSASSSQLPHEPPPRSDPTAGPTLSLQALTVPGHRNTAGRPLLREVSFTLPPRSVALLVGPNGSGKTTLLNTLAAIQPRIRGRIDPPRRTRRASGIGYAPQRGSELMFARTVRQELALAFPGSRPRGSGAEAAHCSDGFDTLLERAGLLRLAETHPQHLSGGQRQRLSVLLAVASAPALVLLDEPTNAQDAIGAARILALIEQHAAQRVCLIATHEEELFTGLATHRIELRDGAVTQVREL